MAESRGPDTQGKPRGAGSPLSREPVGDPLADRWEDRFCPYCAGELPEVWAICLCPRCSRRICDQGVFGTD